MKKILIIEDDKILRENTVAFFEEENFVVYSAANGKIGLDMVFQYFPDIILCDIAMPEMDGHEVYRRIQDDHAAALIPFIFLTAKVETEDIRQGMGMGVDDYIIKPFNIDELLSSVNARIERQEKQVRAKEEKYRALTESSLTGVFMMHKNKFEYTNDKFSSITGYSNQELLTMGFADLVLPHEKESISSDPDFSNDILDFSFFKEINILHKSGETRFIALYARITPVHNKKFLVGNILDNTESKKSIDQIIKAKEEAEIANRAKSEFLANISHEIRTPMNGIIGMADLLNEIETNSEKKEYINVIVTSAYDLLKTVNDILEISAIESGKLELTIKPFRFKDTMIDIARIMNKKALQKNLEFNFTIDAQCPENLIGDESKLRQVLYNVLGNAIKFTAKGQVSLSVSCSESNNKKILVSFSVEDTGIGIETELHNKIFGAFMQADSSYTSSYSGTGLGLTIAKKIIELMSGKIWLQSQKEKGSIFYFNILLDKP